MKFHFISSNTSEAIKAKEEYINLYNQTPHEGAPNGSNIGKYGGSRRKNRK